ncbi:MAG: hypothetical protein ACKOEX_02010 [Planctomycetia bacterium]
MTPDTLPLVLDWTPADAALLVAVTAMGVAVASLRNPEHKATVLMLPVPFSLAMFSVGCYSR